jgi:hypothetical protein
MIDTDLHPMVPSLDALRPHLEPLWADAIAQRGLEGFESQSYPPNSPLTVAPQFRPAKGGFPDLPALQAFLDETGTTHAILNCLYGVQLIFNADMNAGFTRGLNDWIRAEWLDRDPRLRAAIILPNEPEHAVAEIERLAPDRRFVQALRLVIPPTVNTFIGLFKDTTLVVVIGVFDFFTTLRAALGDPNWLGFPTEAYLFAAGVYFLLCFAMSRYSMSLEKSLRPGSR